MWAPNDDAIFSTKKIIKMGRQYRLASKFNVFGYGNGVSYRREGETTTKL